MGRLKALPSTADTSLLFSTHPSPEDRITSLTEPRQRRRGGGYALARRARIKTAQ